MTNITRKPSVRLDTYLGRSAGPLSSRSATSSPARHHAEHPERIDQRVEHIRELLNTLGILRIMAKKGRSSAGA